MLHDTCPTCGVSLSRWRQEEELWYGQDAEIVRLRQQIAAGDPYQPNWDAIPVEYQWATVDKNGQRMYWALYPFPNENKRRWETPSYTDFRHYALLGPSIPIAGLDWRNSLRHRPEPA